LNELNHYEFNIRCYPFYKASVSALAWLPVFFLYFSSRLGIADVLRLEVVYFLSVVALEVPSGFVSDRIGRRKTLLLACSFLITAYVCFVLAPNFAILALGQFFLAAGIASQSGTDTALHYESLAACGRENEYGQREARAERMSFAANASAALVGGFLGAINLRWPYLLSAVTAILAFILIYRFHDTVRIESSAHKVADTNFVASFLACTQYLRSSVIGWLSAFYVVIYVVSHVPYEFYQPYLKLTYEGNVTLPAPIVSGCIFAATAFAGSLVAGWSVSISRRVGLVPLLFVAAGIELIIMGCLAWWFNPLLAFIVVLRNVPMALTDAPLRDAIVPGIDQRYRAMFLSLQSLGGRLAFAGLLYLIAVLVPDPTGLSANSIRFAFAFSLLVSAIALLALFLSRRAMRRFSAGSGVNGN